MSRIYQEAWDHWHTDDPVCPHCGELCYAAWELFEGPDNLVEHHECEKCEKSYMIERHVDVCYTTKPISEDKGGNNETL
jgi:phage terminase large subunit GpA-like protein